MTNGFGGHETKYGGLTRRQRTPDGAAVVVVTRCSINDFACFDEPRRTGFAHAFETTRDDALRYNFRVFSSPAGKVHAWSAGHKQLVCCVRCRMPERMFRRLVLGCGETVSIVF
ncbi:hypothetical protein [Burkholderia singularis]|uniref:hypothetical protein n=1 Tax=Burkholderia singularis TaxID=1503053 RepID=UPI000B774199|nr:hypothetical protein [Burkholderia singularis]